MKSTLTQAMAVLTATVIIASTAMAAERAWQKGTWKDIQVKRPKIVFGVSPNAPPGGAARGPAAAQETRIYVIETDDQRLELQEVTTVDAPRLAVLVGDPVEFAIEKKTIYVKDADGHEHRFTLTKQAKR